jgi:hypothetical protein
MVPMRVYLGSRSLRSLRVFTSYDVFLWILDNGHAYSESPTAKPRYWILITYRVILGNENLCSTKFVYDLLDLDLLEVFLDLSTLG